MEAVWRRYTEPYPYSHRVWSDAYLAAFAAVAGLTLATFDQGFGKFSDVPGIGSGVGPTADVAPAVAEAVGHPGYFTSRAISLNSGVPASRSSSNRAVSTEVMPAPAAFIFSSPTRLLAGVRDDTASSTTSTS